MREDIIKARLDVNERRQAKRLKQMLGITEDSTLIRACLNCTENVTRNLFGGNFGQLFVRKHKEEDEKSFEERLLKG